MQYAAAQTSANTYAEATLTSQDLIPGTQINLIVKVVGTQPNRPPTTPVIKSVSVNYAGTTTYIDSQRNLGYAFIYKLTPVKVGNYTIPTIDVSTASGIIQTNPISFTVHSSDKLLSFPTGVQNQQIKAIWFPEKTSLYPGEQCSVVLNLYIPKTIRIVNSSYPDPVKTNCLAWRFSLPSRTNSGEVSLNNISHRVVTYSTTLSGIKPGTATLGPSKLTLHQRSVVMNPRRGYTTKDTPINLELPAIHFDIKPLPAGAPQDFHGAVGDFKINAYAEKTTLTQDEPTEVILRIAGSGNLTTIKAPVLNSDSWKIIDTSKVTRGEERRLTTGMVTFRQLIRPAPNQALPNSIPEYSFSYFNPEKEIYQTVTTAAIPVTILPSVTQAQAPPEKLGTRPEEMRNILGFIDRSSTQSSIFSQRLFKYWQLIPAIICLLILLPIIRKKINNARAQHPDTQQQNAELAKITENSDTRTFYRRAGRFIEQWLKLDPELEKVLQERDTFCFTQDPAQQEEITSTRKAEIINLLKRHSKLALLLLLSLILTPNIFANNNSSELAKSAWKSGAYQEAISHYRTAYPEPENTPADVLFNIGNCHYRLQQQGAAALAWRQALRVDPTHQQAQQNLRFVEIQNNALVPEYKPWQFYLLHFHPHTYKVIFYSSLWIIAIIILVIIARRPNGVTLTTLIIFLVISPTLATLAKVATHYYPDDHHFAPTDQQAVLLVNTKLYQEAHRQAEHTSIPAASLIKINAARGPWTNISTANDSIGWVETTKISAIFPNQDR